MTTDRLKGWMIDAARLPEPLAYYRRVIDFCAGWRFNAILFRLTDDQGSAFRFESHPELITHPHAYTPAELRELVAYAAARGIELIPEIESFGHTSYITDCPAYAELLDADPAGTATFTGLIPVHAGSLTLMDDLYQEVAAVFPSRYLHGGCDEVNWGGSERSRQAIAEQGRAEVWAGYVNRLGRLAHDCGKEFIIWGDHGLRGDGAILDRLDKDIILMDWNYWDTEPSRGRGESVRPGPVQWAADAALARGFRLMGAPAWGWCRWGTRAGAGATQKYRCLRRYLPGDGRPEESGGCGHQLGPEPLAAGGNLGRHRVCRRGLERRLTRRTPLRLCALCGETLRRRVG